MVSYLDFETRFGIFSLRRIFKKELNERGGKTQNERELKASPVEISKLGC